MYNQMIIESANAEGAIARNTTETFNNTLQQIGTTARSIFDILTNKSLTFAEKMKQSLSTVLNMLAKIAVNAMSSMPGTLGIIGKIGSLFFADGGIVPGSYSQEKIATVHGSEMVLNPSQQARLFSAANGNATLGNVPSAAMLYPFLDFSIPRKRLKGIAFSVLSIVTFCSMLVVNLASSVLLSPSVA